MTAPSAAQSGSRSKFSFFLLVTVRFDLDMFSYTCVRGVVAIPLG